MPAAFRFGSSAALLLLGAGCSFVDPQVGARQDNCGIASGGSGSGPGAHAYSAGTSPPATPTCASSSDDECEACESDHCCAPRSACYGDPVCACADLSLDECLSDAAELPAAQQPMAVSGCWQDFAARGAVEQAKLSCERAWCQSACNIP